MQSIIKLHSFYKISARIAIIIVLFGSCKGNPTQNNQIKQQENLETKALLDFYVTRHLKKDSIYLAVKPYSRFTELCIEEIVKTHKNLNLTTDEIISQSRQDTLYWRNDLVPFAKILTQKNLEKFKDPSEFMKATYNGGYFMFSHPIFSKDFKFAILQTVFLCGDRCGQEDVILLEKKPEGWHLLNTYCTGVF